MSGQSSSLMAFSLAPVGGEEKQSEEHHHAERRYLAAYSASVLGNQASSTLGKLVSIQDSYSPAHPMPVARGKHPGSQGEPTPSTGDTLKAHLGD